LVCYDSVFPDWVRRNVKDGAAVIGIITNDGWWGDTGGHEQHFSYARLRAVETRRSVARSANNGISGVILPDGTVQVRTVYWTQTVLRTSVPVYDTMTLYTRFGDWIVWLVVTVGLAAAWHQPRIDTTMFKRKS
jgi:apolipoprotein N-acyltransferase